MNRNGVLIAAAIGVLAASGWFLPVRAQDTVTLKSGEVVKGRIVSSDDKVVEIEIANKSRTILTKRKILTAEVATTESEAPAIKEMQAAYEALRKYELNPDRVFPAAYYTQVIDVFGAFLDKYPNSPRRADIQQRMAQWKAERENVAGGMVKLDGRWMEPAERQTAAEIRDAETRVVQLRRQLANLNRERNQLMENLAAEKARQAQTAQDLAEAKDALRNKEIQAMNQHSAFVFFGIQSPSAVTFASERADVRKAVNDKSFSAGQVVKGEEQRKLLDDKIEAAEEQLKAAEKVLRAVRDKYGERS